MDTIEALFQALETGLLQLCAEHRISLHQYRQTLASLTIAEMTVSGYLAYDAPLTHALEQAQALLSTQQHQHGSEHAIYTN